MSESIEKGQILTWTLNLITAVGLLIGAWYFNGLNKGIENLRSELADLKTEVAVLNNFTIDLQTLKLKLDTHINANGIHKDNARDIAILKERIKAIENKIKDKAK